ncbi:uncharacterized protein LOC133892294 [Phragmites australis]|uniref:uncharacterized protein LOC133892294 n=1 Tax=Phragmites australis TaxID=29695 RepID=UPI002D76AEFE|nr:uncharacterized protein LOC133892294 [Phragmites australis]
MAALMDELVEEVLLRFPPHKPGRLIRAALVCKRWRSIVSDPGFRRRFREFHRTPPIMGVFSNLMEGDTYIVSFEPCALCPPHADRRDLTVLDSRHGRVLLHSMPPAGRDHIINPSEPHVLVVWDPITDEQRELLLPYLYPGMFYAAVLCAATVTCCDHLDCNPGPFLVLIVGTDLEGIFVYVYSSEASAWSEPSSIHLGAMLSSYCMLMPSLLAGDALYFMLEDGHRILKYDLGGRAISMINPPSLHAAGKVALVTAKDGGLGVAGVHGYNLHTWSWRAGPNGTDEWVKERVIELDTMLSITIGDPSTKLDVHSFAEALEAVFKV